MFEPIVLIAFALAVVSQLLPAKKGKSMNFLVDDKSYVYTQEIEEQEDCRKIYHLVIDLQTNEVTEMDWSPYDTPSMFDLVDWIRLGMPDREHFGKAFPINHEDLQGATK